MSLVSRLALAAGGLLACVLAQAALQAHLHNADEVIYPELRRELKAFPLEGPRSSQKGDPVSLGAWSGKDNTKSATLPTLIPFADEFVARDYVLAGRRGRPGAAVYVYMVYSREGQDREHHPEICIRDAGGAGEDVAARGLVALDEAGERAAMRFRFLVRDQLVTVHYWHYTLQPEVRESLSALQVLHQRWSRRAPSVTVEVSTLAPPGDADVEDFLRRVDRIMLAGHLPATATIGHDRLPIRLVGKD